MRIGATRPKPAALLLDPQWKTMEQDMVARASPQPLGRHARQKARETEEKIMKFNLLAMLPRQ